MTNYEKLFPALHEIILPTGETAYEFCVKGYSGGWCWRNPVADGKVYAMIGYDVSLYTKYPSLTPHILVIDVNSLYPSVMESSLIIEGYPVGKPGYAKGEPNDLEISKFAIFRRFRCRFRIKKGYLPFIHIRHERGYNANECLSSSEDALGNDPVREYTMTQPEFELFAKHYDIIDYEPIDYIVFNRRQGIFDDYIAKYKQMKIDATKTGNKAMREIAKLFLNNLYGKLATSTNSSYKTIRFEDGVMKFDPHTEYAKKPIYIAAGAYVTAYARRFTITAGQANYFEGQDKGVMYADTDSLHIVGMKPDEVQGCTFHDSDFRCWDVEASECICATWAKQKTYIEVVTEESFKKLKEPKIVIKAAGLGKGGKELFKKCVLEGVDNPDPDKKEVPKLYLDQWRKGLEMKDVNLKATQVKGGIVLKPDDFKIR